MDIRTPIPTIYGNSVEKYSDSWKTQIQELRGKFGAAIEEVLSPPEAATDVPIIYVSRNRIVEILQFAKEAAGFEYQFLADLTAIDNESEPRFEVVYNLLSHPSMIRIRLKVRVGEGEEVPTVISVWKGANWAEREVYDMFGIRFSGHPDLRRVLMDHRWEGHPLRKDYPLKKYQIFSTPEDIDPELLK